MNCTGIPSVCVFLSSDLTSSWILVLTTVETSSLYACVYEYNKEVERNAIIKKLSHVDVLTKVSSAILFKLRSLLKKSII